MTIDERINYRAELYAQWNDEDYQQEWFEDYDPFCDGGASYSVWYETPIQRFYEYMGW